VDGGEGEDSEFRAHGRNKDQAVVQIERSNFRQT